MDGSRLAERRIVVYSTSWCPYTRRVRDYLRSRALDWTEIDIDEDETAARQVEAWNHGDRIVPTVLVDDVVLTNPKADDLDRALGHPAERSGG